MPKVDLKKDLKRFYQPSAKEVVRVDVPAFRFLMISIRAGVARIHGALAVVGAWQVTRSGR